MKMIGVCADFRRWRHVDVEQDHGELVLQDQLERFLPRAREDQILAQLVEDYLIDHQLLGQIVYHENLGALGVGHGHNVMPLPLLLMQPGP
jgi:hypothetical protein